MNKVPSSSSRFVAANARIAAGEAAAKAEAEAEAAPMATAIFNTPRGGRQTLKFPANILDLKTPTRIGGVTRGGVATKTPLENIVISTPSGQKFTIKANPQSLKGSKYKLAAVPLKGLSQHLKSGVLKLAPASGVVGADKGPQQIKMKILGDEGQVMVNSPSATRSSAQEATTVLDMRDITKSAADLAGVAMDQGAVEQQAQISASVVGNDTVIHVQQPKPSTSQAPAQPPPPAQPLGDQTYYQCGDCSMLFKDMETIQYHLKNECGAAVSQAQQAQSVAHSAGNLGGIDTATLGSIPTMDSSEMPGTQTIDLGHMAAGTSGIASVEGGMMAAADPTQPMTSMAFDAGLQVRPTLFFPDPIGARLCDCLLSHTNQGWIQAGLFVSKFPVCWPF